MRSRLGAVFNPEKEEKLNYICNDPVFLLIFFRFYIKIINDFVFMMPICAFKIERRVH